MLSYFLDLQLCHPEVYPALRVTSLLQLKVTLQNFDPTSLRGVVLHFYQ